MPAPTVISVPYKTSRGNPRRRRNGTKASVGRSLISWTSGPRLPALAPVLPRSGIRCPLLKIMIERIVLAFSRGLLGPEYQVGY